MLTHKFNLFTRQQVWKGVELLLKRYTLLTDKEGSLDVEVILTSQLEEMKQDHEQKVKNLNNR